MAGDCRIRAALGGLDRVRLVRTAGLVLAVCISLAVGCGKKSEKSHHGRAAATPERAAPTPDTTPIEALRTPAGLVLRIDATQTPAAAPTPSKP